MSQQDHQLRLLEIHKELSCATTQEQTEKILGDIDLLAASAGKDWCSLLATSQLRDELVALIPLVTTAKAIGHFLSIISQICAIGDAARRVFQTEQIRDAFATLFQRISALDEKDKGQSLNYETALSRVLSSDDDEEGVELFSTKDFVRSLRNFGSDISRYNPQVVSTLQEAFSTLEKAMKDRLVTNTLKTLQEKNLFIPFDEVEFYDFRKKLGGGSFGSVYSAKIISSGKEVAVKQFNRNKLYDACVEASNYLSICSFKCEHVVEFVGAIQEEDAPDILMLVFELAAGSLRDVISRSSSSSSCRNLNRFYHILLQVAAGLAFLHRSLPPTKRQIIHFDLKPENILVFNKESVFKVADFGENVKTTIEDGKSTEVVCRTAAYTPPEFGTNGYMKGSPQFDIFSFGVSALELVTRKPRDQIRGALTKSFGVKNPEECFATLVADIGIEAEVGKSKLLQVLFQCVKADRAERPKSGVYLLELLTKSCKEDCPDFDHWKVVHADDYRHGTEDEEEGGGDDERVPSGVHHSSSQLQRASEAIESTEHFQAGGTLTSFGSSYKASYSES